MREKIGASLSMVATSLLVEEARMFVEQEGLKISRGVYGIRRRRDDNSSSCRFWMM